MSWYWIRDVKVSKSCIYYVYTCNVEICVLLVHFYRNISLHFFEIYFPPIFLLIRDTFWWNSKQSFEHYFFLSSISKNLIFYIVVLRRAFVRLWIKCILHRTYGRRAIQYKLFSYHYEVSLEISVCDSSYNLCGVGLLNATPNN